MGDVDASHLGMVGAMGCVIREVVGGMRHNVKVAVPNFIQAYAASSCVQFGHRYQFLVGQKIGYPYLYPCLNPHQTHRYTHTHRYPLSIIVR